MDMRVTLAFSGIVSLAFRIWLRTLGPWNADLLLRVISRACVYLASFVRSSSILSQCLICTKHVLFVPRWQTHHLEGILKILIYCTA